MDNKFNNGSVKISNDIISLIAAEACMEVEGVKAIVTPQSEKVNIQKGAQKSVIIEILDNAVNVRAHIEVDSDYNIKDVCYKVQKKIKENIGMMTGLVVINVDVVCEKISI
ncbi:MAG: Asp23/Gls24 family envelope stress response protein [Finegoldia sp.]|uniref:Asp23/Gls24 family envelope stress response protein n=1 Tax=Finegoldia sp. TaxID=1981334 RepID=UPI0025E08A2D|nr:Asp23/Gls24 family envelope stress response protein [uncultured Finegoldia sp.]MDU1832851.1 Asp23/Gls24 family envelope stress response protein [Finegoldia magna]MDU1878702.1 Asp23/Gls24 family envelope stress response protein [Finegoldia magna]